MKQPTFEAFTCMQIVNGKEVKVVISSEKQDRFFSATECDRCGQPLVTRTMSFFTHETICMSCSGKEDEIKRKLRAQGKEPRLLEGCGKVPEV